MDSRREEEEQEERERAKQQFEEEQDEEKEEELDENAAPDEEGASSKFEHSMDDDDEDDEDDNRDTHKKKKDKDKDEDDDEDEEDEDDEKKKNKDDDDDENDEDGERDDINNRKPDDDGSTDQFDDDNHISNTADDFTPEEQEEPQDSSSNRNYDDYDDESDDNSRQPPKDSEEDIEDIAEDADELGADTLEGAESAGESDVIAMGPGAGEAAETAAASGETAAAGTAAGGAAGTAAAGAGGSAIAMPLLIALAIILIIFILIGIAGFWLTMPQFIWNSFKKMALSVWNGLEGYVVGMDEALVEKEDVIGVAQYLYDMGYDLVGMGFAEEVEIYGGKDENGNEIPVENGHQKGEIKSVEAPYLRSYLVAENRTYLVNNFTFNVSDFAGSFYEGTLLEEGSTSWGAGMLNFDFNLIKAVGLAPFYGINLGPFNVGELVEGIKVERETNTLRIRRLNPELAFWNTHFDYTYYNLSGWSGRYGKPFELLMTMHVATMAPDLVKEFAMNDDLDAKVNIKLKDTTFRGNVYVDGKSIDELESEGIYSDDTIQALRDLEERYAEEIKTSVPYISSVTKHWFRNVYFEGTDSIGVGSSTQVGIDEDGDGLEDYNEETGEKTQKTRTISASDSVYEFEPTDEELTYQGDPIPGLENSTITFRGTFGSSVNQTKDAIRGVTNPTTKALFKGGRVNGRTYSGRYYIYDGTIEKAKEIQEARRNHDTSIQEEIALGKNALNAFSILEGSETLDAQFIYRDLKELVIELGYFEREDFVEQETQILEWPIPDYTPAEWPDREVEKQILEYGTLMASEQTIANSLNITVEELHELREIGEGDEEVFEDMLFVGDSYIVGLENAGNIDGATFRGRGSTTPQYWLNNLSSLPTDNVKAVTVYLGVNGPTQIDQMKGLIDALVERYPGKKIYIMEVMHLGRNYANIDRYNSMIDTFNAQIRTKCRNTNNVFFIDTSQGLVSGGYLADPDSSGIHMKPGNYPRWAENIKNAITRETGRTITQIPELPSQDGENGEEGEEGEEEEAERTLRVYSGFEPDKDVIAMGNGKVMDVLNSGNNVFSQARLQEAFNPGQQTQVANAGLVQDGVKIKLTDTALKGYTLVIYGINVRGITKGQEVRATDVIGTTRADSDICIVLIDRDKAIVEDVEKYMKLSLLNLETGSGSGTTPADLQNIQNLDMDSELEALIERLAGPYESEYPGIVNIIKAISMNESGGGKNPAAGDDPMQAAESMGQAAGSGVGGKERSVQAAIAALTSSWDKAKDLGIDDVRVVIQAYNYGPGFVSYVANHSSDKKYSKQLAQQASAYFASQQGWSSYGDPNYVDPKIYRYLPDLNK